MSDLTWILILRFHAWSCGRVTRPKKYRDPDPRYNKICCTPKCSVQSVVCETACINWRKWWRAEKSNMASNMAAKVENPDLFAIFDFYWIQIIIRQFILKLANAERMVSIKLEVDKIMNIQWNQIAGGHPISFDCYHFDASGWLGRAVVLGSFQCQGVLLLWHMVGQGPAVLAAGAGQVGCFFFVFFYFFLFLFFFFFFSSRLSYLF